jgi:Uma2 family endonuclease
MSVGFRLMSANRPARFVLGGAESLVAAVKGDVTRAVDAALEIEDVLGFELAGLRAHAWVCVASTSAESASVIANAEARRPTHRRRDPRTGIPRKPGRRNRRRRAPSIRSGRRATFETIGAAGDPDADYDMHVATVVHPHLDAPEYLALQADAGWRLSVELIDGEAVVIPPTGAAASSAQIEMVRALRAWQEHTGDRGLVLQDVFVRFPGDQFVAPDIAWWTAERRPASLPAGAIDRIPDLTVEVLSPATEANDLGIKRELYLASGVRELWLVDPRAKNITRVRPNVDEHTAGLGDKLQSGLLPAFELALDSVFRD